VKYLMLHNFGLNQGLYTLDPKRMALLSQWQSANMITFDDGYRAVFDVLSLKGDDFCRRCILFPVVGKVGGRNDWDRTGELAGLPLLTWEQAWQLKERGVRFGSHGLTHVDLTKLCDKELERETKESKRILEERLDKPIEGFAYPHGFFNAKVISAVKDAGYKWAVTTSDSIWEGWRNPYRLRRIRISGLDPDCLFKLKMNGLYDIKAVWELPCLAVEKISSLGRKES
jgi:hypothetical protein